MSLNAFSPRCIRNIQQEVPSQTFVSDDGDLNGYAGGSAKMEKSLVRKQDIRLIPLCVCVYLLCFLDRANIGSVPSSSNTFLVLCMLSKTMYPTKTIPKATHKSSTVKAATIYCSKRKLHRTGSGTTAKTL